MRTRSELTVFGLTVVGAASVFQAVPAFAIESPDCGEAQVGSILSVVAGNCEAVFAESGEYSFVAPEEAELIQAIVVGAGGGATEVSANENGYGGGGGEVIFVDTVANGETIAVTIGTGGASGNTDGGGGGNTLFDTTTARGGGGGAANGWAGASGDGSYADNSYVGGGSIDDGQGTGYLPSDIELVDDSVLFPLIDSELELGRGGRFEQTPAEIGFGWGGSSWNGVAQPGSDGAVLIRWKPAGLASTGFEFGNAFAVALAAAAVGFVAMLSPGRRRG